MIVEAGLGRGFRDFRTMRLHTLPGARPTAEMWKAAAAGEKVEDRPAYANLINDGVLDHCGMTLLAGKAVGAPFVGAVAATLARSEEHTSELQSLMRISYAVYCLKKKNNQR